MATDTKTSVTTQVHEIYIRATPQAIWDAITTPEWTAKYEAEGFTRVTWEIEPSGAGFSRLTVTHELEGAPIMAGMVASKFSEMGAGGWGWILSDLKTLLETGATMGG
jgi:hypothetical protein